MFACLSTPVFGEDLKPEDLYQQVLPSVMTLMTETDEGTVLGTGFLTMKDGVAVTAWHVMVGAKRAVATFSSGETFEVSGLIDKDEKRDVCLIRVKVAGRPLLPIAAGDPAVGSKAFVIGAPLGLDFTVSDGLVSQIRLMGGVKQYQFTCAISHGNSGGPLVNQAGEVLGVVDSTATNGQNLNFAIPMVYVQGLDASLPTTPWDQVKASIPITEQKDVSDDEADKLLAESYLVMCYWVTTSVLMDKVLKTPLYKEDAWRGVKWTIPGIPPNVYTTLTKAVEIRMKLQGIRTTGFRENIRHAFIEYFESVINACQYFISGVEAVQKQKDWSGEPSNLISKSAACMQLAKPLPQNDFAQLCKSEAFLQGIPLDLKYANGMQEDPCGLLLGISVYWEAPLSLVVVQDKSFAQTLGLQAGDWLLSVDGKALTMLQDFKVSVKEHLGKTIETQVLRGGKKVKIRMRIPKAIPKEALRNPAS